VAVHADEAHGAHADESPMRAAAEHVRGKIAGQVDDLRHAGFATADLRPVVSGCHSTARLIADAASEFEADLIVVASDGHRPLVPGALGGVSLELLSLAPCPVLAVPELTQWAVGFWMRVPSPPEPRLRAVVEAAGATPTTPRRAVERTTVGYYRTRRRDRPELLGERGPQQFRVARPLTDRVGRERCLEAIHRGRRADRNQDMARLEDDVSGRLGMTSRCAVGGRR
jgi:hypothetical protein